MSTHRLRWVVSREETCTRYNRRGEGGYKDTLECGHVWWGKRSAGTPKRRRCRECKLHRAIEEAAR